MGQPRPSCRKKPLWSVLLIFIAAQSIAGGQTTGNLRGLQLGPEDRLMILAPHPDDEVLGCGGVLQAAVKLGCPVKIIFFTHGDANERSFLVYRKHPVVEPSAVRRMAMLRSQEAVAACRILGVGSNSLTFLGYPDGGTLDIWLTHWGGNNPHRSELTKASSVPYTNAFRFGAAYKGEEIIKDLRNLLQEFRPTKILVSHPGDHHPDHRSLPLFLMVALWQVESSFRPDVFSYLIHYKRWPSPRGYYPETELSPPESLASTWSWQGFALTGAVVERKGRALKAHVTQYEYSSRFLSSFIRRNELFGPFRTTCLNLDFGESSLLASRGSADVEALPEFLLAEEKIFYVGIEKLFVLSAEGNLEFKVDISRRMPEQTTIVISSFGWRRDVDFTRMPKTEVRITSRIAELVDQGRRIWAEDLKFERSATTLKVKIPLQAVHYPQRIFISARTLLNETPLDWTSWQVMELVPKGQ